MSILAVFTALAPTMRSTCYSSVITFAVVLLAAGFFALAVGDTMTGFYLLFVFT